MDTLPVSFARPARRRLLRGLAVAPALPLAALLPGCAGVEPSAYRAERPLLDLRRFLDGELEAWGQFQDRAGRVRRRFTVKLLGTWRGDTGTLEEDFAYSDGEVSRRVWTLHDEGSGRWRGTAPDVVGEARGEAAGNAFNWRYVLALRVDGRTWNVDMDDWMYLVDERTLLNRTTMSKFGIRLGEVTLFFRRPAA